MKLLVSLPVAAIALLSAAAPARADDVPPAAVVASVDPGPAGEVLEERYPPSLVRLKLIAAGVVVTGLAWGAAFACASSWPYVPNPAPGAESGPPGSGQLKIPVAGPWIALGHSGCAPDEPDCAVAKVAVRDVLMVIDGLVQAAGVALIVEAVVMKTSPEKAKKSSLLGLKLGGVEVRPVPVMTPTMQGLGFSGSF
jgi:hypothetical protein